jgi:pantoate--beta-alanine ligase
VELITGPSGVLAHVRGARRTGERVALVPTMGALHAGHAALMMAAREQSEQVVLSIFVNPLQFNRAEDLEHYPRDLDGDLDFARKFGVDVAFVPDVQAMYPSGTPIVQVDPGQLADRFEGAARPGHFRGVATVVTKLLSIVEPDAAYFGEKDYQQLVIVRRLAADLSIPVEIIGIPTIREPDGLALSSRNRRLSATQRTAAAVLHRALMEGRESIRGGADPVAAAAVVAGRVASEPLARLDYAEVTDVDLARPVEGTEGPLRILVAAEFGTVRLIDNVAARV